MKSDQQTDWVARSLQSVWHPCTQMQHHAAANPVPLIPISHGRGAWLYDTGNRRYLDAISSWWVNLFGHANPRINAALKDQLDTLEHAMLAGCTHEPVVRLSEQLAARTGGVLGPLLLCLGRRLGGRDRAEDEFPLLAQQRPSGQARIRLPAEQLSRRNHRRAGGDRRRAVPRCLWPACCTTPTWSPAPTRGRRATAKRRPMSRAAPPANWKNCCRNAPARSPR